MANQDIPGFEPDENLESLLTTPVSELDEDTRLEVQRYKAQKLKAKRDADMSGERPDWWGEGMHAPVRADTAFSDGRETTTEEPPSGETQPPAEEDVQEPAPEEETAVPEPPSEEDVSARDTEAAAEEPEPSEAKQPAIPQVGWSSGAAVEAFEEVEEGLEETAEEEPTAETKPTPEAGPPDEPAAEEPSSEAEAPEPAPEEEAAEAEEGEEKVPAPEGGPRHAGRFRIHVGPDPDQLPNFDADPELEELLGRDITQFDEDKRQDIQLYRARKIKAMRDAGIEPSEDTSIGETVEAPPAAEPTEKPAEPEAAAEEPPAEAEAPEPAPEEEAAEAEEGEEEAPTEEEPQLTREDLGPAPSEEELIQAGLIDQEVEQDDSEGIFFTTVDRRKAYLAYSKSDAFLTLYYYQIPTSIDDHQWRVWVKDLLARTAFEFAEQNDLKVIPRASDVARGFLLRHPEYFERVKANSERRIRLQEQRLASGQPA